MGRDVTAASAWDGLGPLPVAAAVPVLLFMSSFIAIGGEWFQMWKSQDWNGLDPAFRNAVLALAALVVHLPSMHWQVPVSSVSGA